MFSGQPTAKDRIEQILEAIVMQGDTSARQIAERLDLSVSRVRHLAYDAGVHIPVNTNNGPINFVESRVRRKELLANFLYLLQERAKDLSRQESMPAQKAMEYLDRKDRRRATLSFSILVEFFSRYEKAEQDGRSASLVELSDGLFSHTYASRILSAMGKKAFNSTPTRGRTLQKNIIECISRGYRTELSKHDVAYFLGLSKRTIDQFTYGRVGIERPNVNAILYLGRHGPLTLKAASQVYEAVDLGFAADEISELLGLHERAVAYSIENRSHIEPAIVDSLKTMYKSNEINRPYLTAGQRQILLSRQKAS